MTSNTKQVLDKELDSQSTKRKGAKFKNPLKFLNQIISKVIKSIQKLSTKQSWSIDLLKSLKGSVFGEKNL